MLKFKEHRPGYFIGFENKTYECQNFEELMNLEFIKNFQIGNGKLEFHQYSISKRERADEPHKLMAEYNQGEVWYVVGYLYDDEALNKLPEWQQ